MGAQQRGFKPQVFRENRGKFALGKSGLFGADWALSRAHRGLFRADQDQFLRLETSATFSGIRASLGGGEAATVRNSDKDACFLWALTSREGRLELLCNLLGPLQESFGAFGPDSANPPKSVAKHGHPNLLK